MGEDYQIESKEMNALEIACSMGHSKIVSYFVDECQLRSIRDF